MTSCFYIIYDIIPIHLPVIPAFMFMQINLKTWDLNHGGKIAAKNTAGMTCYFLSDGVTNPVQLKNFSCKLHTLNSSHKI